MIELGTYLLAISIGLIMGLIGSGGSILTVPILVYLLSVEPVLATAYSLFIVGVTSLTGAMTYLIKGLVAVKTAIYFSIPSFIAVYVSRRYVIPILPEDIAHIGTYTLKRGVFLMVLFAVLMLGSALSMLFLRLKERKEASNPSPYFYGIVLLEGFLIGTLTGLVGAGGGFLIIPGLVLILRLPMKLAIGTSLTIIAIKSLLGFVGDIQNHAVIDWSFLTFFTLLAIVGIFIGMYVTKYIRDERLKPIFGYFVLIMSALILVKELVLF